VLENRYIFLSPFFSIKCDLSILFEPLQTSLQMPVYKCQHRRKDVSLSASTVEVKIIQKHGFHNKYKSKKTSNF